MSPRFGFFLLLPAAQVLAQGNPANLADRLEKVRVQKVAVERAMVDSDRAKKTAEDQIGRLKALQGLQTQEKRLTEKRLKTLEKYLGELQERKSDVQKRIHDSKNALRSKISKLIHPVIVRSDSLIRGEGGAGEAFIRDRVITAVASLDLKDLEGLKVDLQDAEEIEGRIEREKMQISALMQDVKEQESLLDFHRKLREEVSAEHLQESVRQLEEYRRLKNSEVEIEKMIADFEGRQRGEDVKDQRRRIPFVSLKPKSLPWPVRGRMIGTYGPRLDARTGLNVFSKGIELQSSSENAPVQSVMEGRVQFSGTLPGKGKVLIIEHPHSIYSIYGGLGEVYRTSGQEVKAEEKVASLEREKPLYFEIRSGNVAVDPVKWLQ
jgi:septal ring factor EnvC (AmiA/AmiB activator)